MKIYVHNVTGMNNDTVRQRVEKRVQNVLKKYEAHIRHVVVQLLDINGPKGGADKSCRIEVRMTPGGIRFVEETTVSLYEAVDRAVNKAANAISRTLSRNRTRQRVLAA